MPKKNALPRPIGATVLALSLAFAAAVVMPAASLAAPPGGGSSTLALSPLTLPATTVGNQSPTQEFDVVNEGEAEASIVQVTIDGSDAGQFNFGGSNCGSLQPGGHCSVWIGFAPSSAGAKDAAVSFHFGDGSEQSFALSASGASPQLSFVPAGHDFGVQWVNRGASTFLRLENSGQAPVQMSNLEIVGAGSNAFWAGSSDCWGRWLAPGDSCSVEASFGPHETVAYAAELRAWANGSAFSAPLSGVGGQALIEPSESPVAFGSVTAGASGAVRTITMTNSGSLPGGFFIGIISGGDAGSFHLLDENCTNAVVLPAATCVAHIRFTPQGPGVKAARLSFFGESEGPTMVPLTGEGVAPTVTLAPAGYDFGPIAEGAKTAGHSFAIRNESSTPVDLDSPVIVGADVDQFALAGDTCTGVTLGAGGECLVRVRFTPDSSGAKVATLRVGGDAGALTASLAGAGVAVEKTNSRVTFHWRGAGRSLGHGTALSAGRAHCHASGGCRMTISPQVILDRPHRARSTSARVAGLPQMRLALSPNGSARLNLHVTAPARRLIEAGGARLRLRVSWSADGRIGHASSSTGIG
ncbi:MAG TPA: choice-of-anchor D domain-containing protein [Solirubrobacterales bacterium]